MHTGLLEASPDCIKILSVDGRLQFMNRNGRCLMEIDDFDQISSAHWPDLWPREYRDTIEQAIATARSGGVVRLSAPCPTAKGTPKWWDVFVSPIRDETGAIVSIMSTSRDVTHLKAVELSLKESEQRFRALADTIPQLAWISDPEGNISWFNQRWLDYTGLSLEQSTGRGWRQAHDPEHLDRVASRFLAVLERGEDWEDTFPLRGRDGTYRWFLSRARPLRNATGKAVLYCGTNTDVTEQREQSQRLRQLARVVNMSHEAILVWDREGGILNWNRGCVDLYGYTRHEALGRISHDLLATQHPVPRAEFERFLIEEGSWNGELLHKAADGSDVWVESRQELIRVGGRQVILETNRDITERRRADNLRDLLLAEINHRVKNTLAIVQSLAHQTAKTSETVSQFARRFDGRLHALAGAHSILTESNWVGAPIEGLVRAQLVLHGERTAAVSYEGEDVFLPPQVAVQMSLAINELTTNALQHGALTRPTGRVAIRWLVEPSEDLDILSFEWVETGTMHDSFTRGQGFGLKFLDRLNHLPSIKAETKFEPDRLTARITIDIPREQPGPAPVLFNFGRERQSVALHQALPRNAEPDHVLIVQQQSPEAYRFDEMAGSLGFGTVGPVSEPAEIERRLKGHHYLLAIVDLDGLEDKVGDLLASIETSKVPVMVVGSNSALTRCSAELSGHSRMAKPLTAEKLMGELLALPVRTKPGPG
jgi:PAS domain S-box-containing protein